MNTRQLEAQADCERREVENTVGEIRRRLSPGQLLDEVLAYTKDGGGEFLSNLGRQATDNPLPVSLIGAGLGWFLFSKGGNRSPASDTTKTYSSNAGAQRREMPSSSSTVSEAGRNALDGIGDGFDAAKDRLSAAKEGVSDTLDGLKSEFATASQSAKDRIAESAGSLKETAEAAKLRATTATSSAIDFLKDQPLILLGAGLVLGAALGASVPTTETEGQLMGDASDKLKRQAKEAVSDQLDQAKAVGENLYEDIKNEVREGVKGLTSVRPN